jgi:alpha-tubulin suppressor-like RCC1 family protein
LGIGFAPDTNNAVQIPAFSNVVAIAGGQGFSLALKDDGTVWSWGFNNYGQLGDGTTNTTSSPAQVPGIANITAIACGGYFGMALKNNGDVWTWGSNYYGQLADGTTGDQHSPVQSSLSNIAEIKAGWQHGMVRKNDGSVWTFGSGSAGRLGNGADTNSTTPVQVVNLCNGITKVYEVVTGMQASVFPNPSYGIFTIHLVDANKATRLEVINTFGQKVYTVSGFEQPSKLIDLSALPKGMYFLNIDNGKGKLNTKILLQ